jgi:prepilin-type N-terminal cleavage/methylation domain-containing protein
MKKNGFTLIELLVVISIIGLLSSIVLASLREARTKAQITTFKQSMAEVRNAIALYQSDHDGDVPPTDDPNNSHLYLSELSDELEPYLKTIPSLPVVFADGNIMYHLNDTCDNSDCNWYEHSLTCHPGGPNDGYSITISTSNSLAADYFERAMSYWTYMGSTYLTSRYCVMIGP